MNKKAKLIHGFNVKDSGEGTIDLLKKPLEWKGYIVDDIEADYGWTGPFQVLFGNGSRARKLLKNYEEGEVLIGHSNGCTIIARAIAMGMPVKKVIFIHPALDNDWEPPKNSAVERIDVFYSKKDKATKWAAKIPFVLWGDMGTVGPSSCNKVFKRHCDGWKHSEGFTIHPDKFIESC